MIDLRPALRLHAQDGLAEEIAAVGVEQLDREVRLDVARVHHAEIRAMAVIRGEVGKKLARRRRAARDGGEIADARGARVMVSTRDTSAFCIGPRIV